MLIKYAHVLICICAGEGSLDPPLNSDRINSAHAQSFNTSIVDPLLAEITYPEVSAAIKALKLGRSAGPDNLLAEHIKYGGPTLVKWLTKVFNRISVIEEIPSCLKAGLIIPVYKGKGKDPLLPSSYRGITLSSVIAKLYELIIRDRIYPLLNSLNLPDCLQTAYRKGLSCSDAIFATQEALLTHLREGGHPYLSMFDLEKAFDSVEHCVLLEKLIQIGLRGKSWRVISNWYVSSVSMVRIGTTLSHPIPILRGVKQGSVLSPLLFIIVVDGLLQNLRNENAGLSILGTFVGGAAHADDVRTIASSKDTVRSQTDIINRFTLQNNLKLNSAKTEIVKITRQPFYPEQINVDNCAITTVAKAKCLGVWWSHNLSAHRSIQENICKARKAFFAFGKVDAFHGHLNPLSATSIYKTCVLPILLYGSETWLLDSSCLLLLERFQYEIGRRILKLPNNFSGTVVRICLDLPSITCLLLLRKINFLAKLLSADNNSTSARVLTSAIISDPVNVSLIQQCKMLESRVGISIVDECLCSPDIATSIARALKSSVLDKDRESLLSSATTHPTAHLVAKVATNISWRLLWDQALDYGPRGTAHLQRIVHLLSQPIYDNFTCPLCLLPVDPSTSWLSHLYSSNHPITLDSNPLSEQDILDLLTNPDQNQIFNILF